MPEEYISRRDARIAILEKQAGGGLDQKITVGSAEAVINAVPAADVAEVVYGQWEGEGDGYADGEIVLDVWHCSQCGYCIDDGTDNPDCLPKYCPNCGAKMDGAAK